MIEVWRCCSISPCHGETLFIQQVEKPSFMTDRPGMSDDRLLVTSEA